MPAGPEPDQERARATSRPFAGPNDLVALQRLASRRWPQGRHPGGLTWSVLTDQVDGLTLHEVDGRLTDFTWCEDGMEQSSTTPMPHVMQRAATVDVPAPPHGYEVRAVAPDEVAARVEVHRVSWHPHQLPWHPDHRPAYPAEARSGHTVEIYRRIREAPMYEPDLDLVATGPDRSLVGCCLVWLDRATGVAEIEPLGVVPAHRRRGVAQALCHEATRRVALAGGHQVVINQWPNPAYPAPAGAYAKAGFELVSTARGGVT